MKQEPIEPPDNIWILDDTDIIYVYTSSTGKCYYPEPATKAKIKITIQEAEEKGLKPSKAYLKYLEDLIQQ